MRSQRRKSQIPVRRVEDLEDRVTPSFLGPMGGWEAGMRGAVSAPAEVQRVSTPSPFRYAPTTSGFTFNQGPGRSFFLQFSARPNPIASPTPQPTVNPYARFILMRTNPLNNPSATPTTPASPPTTSANPPATPTTPTNPPATPTNPPATPTPPSPLPPNVAGPLNTLYLDYANFRVDHPDGSYSPPPNLGFPVANNQVGVYVNGNGQGSFSTFVKSLQDAGMSVNASNAVTWTVSGLLPIDKLPTVATNSQTLSIVPRYAPVTFGMMRR